MKLPALGLALLVSAAVLPPAQAGVPVVQSSTSASVLRLQARSDRTRYHLTDSLVVAAEFLNDSDEAIFVAVPVTWGGWTGLGLRANTGVSGDLFWPRHKDLIAPPPESSSDFIRVVRNRPYRTTQRISIQQIGIASEGRYEMRVSYVSSVPRDRTFGLAAWTVDRPTVVSEPFVIEVRR